jgi:hypothetical protein
MLRAILLFTIIGIIGLLFSGCSETAPGASATAGRAQMTIQWPTRSRMIPIAANYIEITLTQASTSFSVSQWVPRPVSGNTTQTTVDFSNLPLGQIMATAEAFSTNETPTTPMAQGTTPLTITAGATATFSIIMESTITQLVVTPSTETMLVNQSATIGVTAKNASGSIVLVTSASLQWQSLNPSVATVDNAGNVTTLAIGTAYILVTDTESGASASATITVN